jgi:hypothetical protein
LLQLDGVACAHLGRVSRDRRSGGSAPRIEDLCAGWIRHELRKRLDLPSSSSVRSQHEQVELGRFETSDGSLQHLREPLVEQ